jgi:hypothetical protein
VESSNQHCQGWNNGGKQPHKAHYPTATIGNKPIKVTLHQHQVNDCCCQVGEKKKQCDEPIL